MIRAGTIRVRVTLDRAALRSRLAIKDTQEV
jgi:hypothetical protein